MSTQKMRLKVAQVVVWEFETEIDMDDVAEWLVITGGDLEDFLGEQLSCGDIELPPLEEGDRQDIDLEEMSYVVDRVEL